jgi:CotH kinase protein
MSAQQQQAMDSLYAIDNVLTIKITMSQGDWDAVRNEQPKGGVCNFEWKGGARFTWRKATSVEISGTSFPPRTKFNDVGIKKKSFCGSLNSDKPCLHVDFGRFADATAVEALIGTRYITLNNSIQDRSYIRQPLGYRLLEKAGLPNSRCNFARVFVNGTLIGQGIGAVNSPGIFVNAEPIMKRYIERNFNGNMKGNLYEIEHHDDFVKERLDFISVEDLSKVENKADLKLADEQIAAHGIAGAAQVVDLEQFIKIQAMEFYLKHWDGYADNTNNTYIYNDLTAVETPGVGDVKFKLIPWGIDQTFQPSRPFKLGRDGVVAKLVRNDAARRQQLMAQIRSYRETVFGREVQQTQWTPLINKMQALLQGLGVPDVESEIATVRQQLRLAESAGYICAGLPDATAVYLIGQTTGECMHASNSESVPPGVANPMNFEVYRLPLRDDNDKSDLWVVNTLGSGRSLTSQAFGRMLHASNTQVTPQGHKYLYTCPSSNTDHAEEFSFDPVKPDNDGDELAFTGYFRLTSVRTHLAAAFGMDITPGGRARIHQELPGSRIYFY